MSLRSSIDSIVMLFTPRTLSAIADTKLATSASQGLAFDSIPLNTCPLTAYVLAKNEEHNILKCISALAAAEVHTTVLDSGSTDCTRELVERTGKAQFEPFQYVNHASAYNELTYLRAKQKPWVLILDADMEVSAPLVAEIRGLIATDRWDVVRAPVRMFVDGKPLRAGSLYPDKPIAFRGGQKFFVARGHGEQLVAGCRVATTSNSLAHNDMKPYEAFLQSQVRYAHNLFARVRLGQSNWKDRLRVRSPLVGIASAACSLLLRGGIRAGKHGFCYALDRVIAGLVQYRVCLRAQLLSELEADANEMLDVHSKPSEAKP